MTDQTTLAVETLEVIRDQLNDLVEKNKPWIAAIQDDKRFARDAVRSSKEAVQKLAAEALLKSALIESADADGEQRGLILALDHVDQQIANLKSGNW